VVTTSGCNLLWNRCVNIQGDVLAVERSLLPARLEAARNHVRRGTIVYRNAEKLACLARLEPKLLALLNYQGEGAHSHLTLLRSHEALGHACTQPTNYVRGTLKSFGAQPTQVLDSEFL
jgi:hypothetical protein